MSDKHAYDVIGAAILSAAIENLIEAEKRINFQRPKDMSGDKAVLAAYHSALTTELGELMQELDAKIWKTRTKPIDPKRVADEIADCLAFFAIVIANACAQSGITPRDIADQFVLKAHVNLERAKGQIAGYTYDAATLQPPQQTTQQSLPE